MEADVKYVDMMASIEALFYSLIKKTYLKPD